MEEVGMDTYFMPVTGIGNFNCSQLFLGFISRMINLYPMPQKGDGHIDKAYDDFMRYEGVPSCLHRDLAPEQKSDSIQSTNHRMMVRDFFQSMDVLTRTQLNLMVLESLRWELRV